MARVYTGPWAAPDGMPIWWITTGDERFPEFHQATLAWVRSLGLASERLSPTAAVVNWQGGFELHVDEIVLDEATGDYRVDPLSQNDLLTRRRIIRVPAGSWPAMPDREAEDA